MKYFLSTLCIALFGIAIHATSAFAGTTIPVGPDVLADVDLYNISNPGSTTYHQGDTMRAFGTFYYIGSSTTTVTASAITVGNTQVQLFDDPQVLNTTNAVVPSLQKIFTVNVPTDPGTGTPIAGTYQVAFTIGVSDPGSSIIGNVFVTGPHYHGGITGRKVVYVGQPIHDAFTVRVKNFGQFTPYEHTSAVVPDDSFDGIYTIPAGTAISGNIQYSTSCSGTGCTVGTGGHNYAVAVSASSPLISTSIPTGYHVCRYADAPGIGQYFSPAWYFSGTLSNDTCTDRYPDAETVY